MVGSSAAFALVLRRIVSEVVLIDINADLARAQAEDILHATPVSSPVKVLSGPMESVAGSSIVILACGVSQRPGETRLDLLKRNEAIFIGVSATVGRHAPDAIILVASNPVDIMTEIVAEHGGFKPSRVIGSGTILDTARFRALLGEMFSVSAQSVHGYVIGEHGDSEVLLWSGVQIGGLPLMEFAERNGRTLTTNLMNEIDDRVRRAAYRIIQGKGSTYYGIGAGLARIVQAIRNDEHSVLTLSSADVPGYRGVSISLPRIVGADGIAATLMPSMTSEEAEAFSRSVNVLRAARERP
jgi:L-lactate dehydrogenase